MGTQASLQRPQGKKVSISTLASLTQVVRVWFCAISTQKKRNFQGQSFVVVDAAAVVAVVVVDVVAVDVVLLVLSAKDDDAGKL